MYRLENKQVLNETVTLDDLRLIIQALGEVLVNYKLLSVCPFTRDLFVGLLAHIAFRTIVGRFALFSNTNSAGNLRPSSSSEMFSITRCIPWLASKFTNVSNK